jgi:transcriptional regulator
MTEGLLPLAKPADGSLHTTDSFRVTDLEQIALWLAEYPLVTLASADEHGRPRASVSPLLLRRREDKLRLFAHLDRRNPQLVHIAAARPLLVIAQGPQAYVSPSWFSRHPAAPTYLHVTVHVQAKPELLDPPEAIDVLLDTVAAFEAARDGWEYDGGERYLHAMSSGIAAFELHVTGVQAACKLSQNRDREERDAIATHLERSGDSGERAIADMIRRSLEAELRDG